MTRRARGAAPTETEKADMFSVACDAREEWRRRRFAIGGRCSIERCRARSVGRALLRGR